MVVSLSVPVRVSFGVKEIPMSLVDREIVLTPDADKDWDTKLGVPVFSAESRVV